MKIIKASFWNYKGLRKNGKNGGFSVKLDKNNDVFAIVGENGSGKTTLIENLNPFITPNNFSGKKLEFVDLPGGKEVEWELGNKHYLSKIEFSEQGWTNAKLYEIGEDKTKAIVSGFESGKATTYSSLIEGILMSTHKNISRVNFVGQGTSALINAKPSERKEMIGNMVDDTSVHELIFAEYKEKAIEKKNDILEIKGKIESLKNQVSTIDPGSLVEQVTVDKLKDNIQKSRDLIRDTDEKVKLHNLDKDESSKSVFQANDAIGKMNQIKGDDVFPNFPNKIEISGAGSLEVLKKKQTIIDDNKINQSKKDSLIAQHGEIKSKVQAARDFNQEIKNNWDINSVENSEDVLSKIETLQLSENELNQRKNVAELTQRKFEINAEREKAISKVMSDLSGAEGNIEEIKIDIVAKHKKAFGIDKTLDNEVSIFIDAIVEHFGKDNRGVVEEIAKKSFGVIAISATDAERQVMKDGINADIAQLEELATNIEKDTNIHKVADKMRKEVDDKLVSQIDIIEGLKAEQQSITNNLDKEHKNLELVRLKNKYLENTKFCEEGLVELESIESQVKDTQIKSTDEIDGELHQGYENDKKIESNKYRQRYLELTPIAQNIDSAKATLKIVIDGIEVLGLKKAQDSNDLRLLEEEWSDAVIGNTKRLELEKINTSLTSAKDELNENKDIEKAYNEIKLYAKNIKETIISAFMVNITNLANQYLASDDHSSIKMNLSIEQKGGNFNIRAKQGDMDFQEVNTLSGAESSTVNRALGMAIAFSDKQSKYGVYAFDEADSALSQTNKKAFIENIMDISLNEKVNQLFLISQDSEVVSEIGATKIMMGVK